MDIAEQQLNGFLDRQAAKVKEDRAGQEHANALEAFWRYSERRHREKERQEHLWQRLRFHERQIQNHTATFREIGRRHKTGLAECEQALGITNVQGDDAA